MIIRSRAPFRIGLAGGGTDVSPFCDEYGGAILNATINLFAHTSIIPRNDGKIIIYAVDRNERLVYDNLSELPIDGVLDLQKGIYNRIIQQFNGGKPLSFEMYTSMDVPSGSGLGTSSTLVVSILGAFVEWLNIPLGEYDIAQLAYDIERKDLAMAGGRQDQYAATFGGVNFMEFYEDDKVIVNPLRIKQEILFELEHNLLLYYTETSRESAKIIETQAQNAKVKKEKPVEAMKRVKEQAFVMKEAILKKELYKIGTVLHNSWQHKKQMAQGISNEVIDDIYNAAMDAGATGGKISGAGGGGFMIFYCEDNNRHEVKKAIEAKGGRVKNYQFNQEGLRTWTTRKK